MKTNLLNLFVFLFTAALFGQTGHIMQGVGAVNMSMGGAATAQPLDISGALQWNPAAISAFDDKILKLDVGLFFSSPRLYSSVNHPAAGILSGVTEDDRVVSVMPNIAMVWGKEDSKHTFGASAFGISGFGVTFPESMTNPINMPQPNGFGHIESDYMLLQIGITWAYELTEQISFGIAPTFNYSGLELAPNPTANPTASGYPTTDKVSAFGFGGQVGVYYNSGNGLKLGVSYKTKQSFGEFEFDNTYLDGTTGTNAFKMNYPAIFSLGFGYSTDVFDLAIDFRRVEYENTEGFDETGWTPTASVAGFGWKNISILSAGVQLKLINKLPLRFGYTYSSNPIDENVTFFNIPATAIIKNAFQFGFSYEINEKFTFDAVYHYGDSDGKTTGQMLNPMLITATNPYGAVPGSEISYDMTTSMIMVGVSYKFLRKVNKEKKVIE